MLTATYTLVALSVEQASVRVSLHALQRLLQSSFIQHEALSTGQVAYACDALQRLHDACNWRKLDMFLVPAIRRAGGAAERLLAELDELSRNATDAIGAIGARTGAVAVDTPAAVQQFCGQIDAYCCATLARLEREERELFPIARTVIPGEAWFAIANQMLVHDAKRQEDKSLRKSVHHPALPAAAHSGPQCVPGRVADFAV